MPVIYHLARDAEWREAERAGRYAGTADDRRDGSLHFSTAEQVAESAARHRRGENGIVLVAADAESLGEALRWEPSRRGALFPHLYGELPLAAVLWAVPLPLGGDGLHRFPPLD
ncbi:MAG: DUF952 domain-containing protein [Alphaproteobacteria bacterium]|nr:DUF952 domain-containing protein [Alphaproteobacteria bacterium]